MKIILRVVSVPNRSMESSTCAGLNSTKTIEGKYKTWKVIYQPTKYYIYAGLNRTKTKDKEKEILK
jgi:hypothetical protein